ncbi:MAG: HlyC/CorC family transporter [Pseudomonadota bacterium]|nr:HlyC/CorC family transporter [Pseudomonadota bacterium]
MTQLTDLSLLIILLILILMSAFFSSSETSMMSLNRYRLRHKAKISKAAAIAQEMIARPDRLLGVILTGNNFVNILASSIATILFTRWFGDSGILVASLALTFIILIFAEVTPKTLAALHPEKVAFPAAYVLKPLQTLLYPLVWIINFLSNGLLYILGVRPDAAQDKGLSREELRTLVNESRSVIPSRHRTMLLSILDLEKVVVDDIMVPRGEVVGIDLDDDIKDVLESLKKVHHTRIPVYNGDLNRPVGILHAKKALRFLSSSLEKNKANLLQFTVEPYFVPENTSLHVQLANFQRTKRRIGLVVNEYGDVKGLVTLEDILEEIVGEFTTDVSNVSPDIVPEGDDTYTIDGTISIRELNKSLGWDLPNMGPRTLSGLIIEHLEFFPSEPMCLRFNKYCIEIQKTQNNIIRSAKMWKVTDEEDLNESDDG